MNEDNWYYGGFGYGRHVRPDLSNTQFALMALDAADLSKDDPLWIKAQVFLNRTQARDESNDQSWANGRDSGGFVYVPDGSTAGGGSIDGYGSMTGAGIWSLMLCGVDPKNDDRLKDALKWVKNNYYWNRNPGMSNHGSGKYYYYLSMSKALTMAARVEGKIDSHYWYDDLARNLTSLQEPEEGYWINSNGWAWESIPELATSYALLSLETRIVPKEICRLSWLTFILHSPVDLHIYDPLERHVGMNYTTGEIEVQIPNATYNTSNGALNITVPHLEAGDYRLILIGTGTGNYTLDIVGRVGDTVVSEDSYTGNITKGEVYDATVTVAMITGLSIHVTDAPEPTLETTLTQVSLASLDPTITKVYVSGLNLSDVNETYKPASVTSRSAYMVNSTGAGNFTLRFTGIPNANTITAYKINATNHWIALATTTTTDTITFGMEAGDPPVVFGAPPITPPSGGGGGSGTYPPGWGATPTPTVTATSTPTVPPSKTPTQQEKTVTPAPTKPAPKETPTGIREASEETPAKGKGTPGFTATFAIAGMLAVAYLALRRRQR